MKEATEEKESSLEPLKTPCSSLFRIEWVVGIIITCAICILHIVNATSAGALWRDEANTVGLATMPSLGEVWKGLQYDSFPVVWLLILRTLAALGSGELSDTACRLIGLVVGLSLLSSLWFSARVFRHRVPLVALMLLGLSANVIRWGDTMRAYGFGMFLSVISAITLWRFVKKPSRLGFVVALVAAILAVNTLYYNAITLFAFCMGAIAVMIRRREGLNRVLAILLLGAISALTLIPYASTIRAVGSYSMLVKIPNYDFWWFWNKLGEAVFPGAGLPLFVWLGLVILALMGGVVAQLYPAKFGIGEEQRDAALFASIALLIGLFAHYFFLKVLSYYTQPWYYFSLMTLSAVTLDIILGAVVHQPAARIRALLGSLAILVLAFVPVYEYVSVRLTNVDLIARQLSKTPTKDDLILVTGWHFGVSFSRCYNGQAPWTTLPELESHRYHRYDLIKADMMREDQRNVVQPLISKISTVLKSGHRLFIVGGMEFLKLGREPLILPPAPTSRFKWSQGVYLQEWTILTTLHIQSHALEAKLVRIPMNFQVCDYENISPSIIVASGWKD